MSKIIIYPSIEGCIDNVWKTSNLCKSNFLGVSRYDGCNNFLNISNSILKFNISKSVVSEEILNKAYLYLYIKSIKSVKNLDLYTIKINVNITPVLENVISWDNAPTLSNQTIYASFKKSESLNYIAIDIRKIANYWIKNPKRNYGITIAMVSSDAAITFSLGDSKNRPYLKLITDSNENIIKHEENIIEDINSNEELGGIQLQVRNKLSKIVENNSPIEFDFLVSKTYQFIQYDFTNSEIYISKLGTFMAFWTIGIEGSGPINQLAFYIQNEDKTINIVSSSPVIISGQVMGNALFKVTKPTVLQLLNISGDIIQYPIYSEIQANFTLIQII